MKKKTVIIVESPAKAKTIESILGKDYEVLASRGHIRDLPKSEFGVSEDLEPTFEIIPSKKKIVEKLKKEVDGKKVLLASDMDREGEAIAWHISEVLDVPKKKTRITFSEITPSAIRRAVESVKDIDMKLVHSQFARRMLDRIVGYSISPLLWRIFRINNLSAGRVQSATLKIVCDREREIFSFKPKKFWKVKVKVNGEWFELVSINGKKVGKDLKEEEARKVEKFEDLTVKEIQKKTVRKSPPDPFTTSTLQQAAASKLGFSVKKTMSIAQQLYEGIDTPEGHRAFITYHRTDSTRISEEAEKAARDFISKEFGSDYIGKGRRSKKKGKIQDAHEAIRPVDVNLTPDMAKKLLPEDHAKLYELVWRRFLASRMKPSEYEEMKVVLEREGYEFEAKFQKRIFDGFERVWKREVEERWKEFDEGEVLRIEERKIYQDETKPPERFSEGTLVKEMERLGIGRPSTYAPTISTLLSRKYVVKKRGKLYPTLLGFLVLDYLEKNFPTIVDVKFTAKMEEKLDLVERGEKPHKEVLEEFLKVFNEELERAKREFYKIDYKTDFKCSCGGDMKLLTGKYGIYLKCPNCGKTRSVKPDYTAVLIDGEIHFPWRREDEIDMDGKKVEDSERKGK